MRAFLRKQAPRVDFSSKKSVSYDVFFENGPLVQGFHSKKASPASFS